VTRGALAARLRRRGRVVALPAHGDAPPLDGAGAQGRDDVVGHVVGDLGEGEAVGDGDHADLAAADAASPVMAPTMSCGPQAHLAPAADEDARHTGTPAARPFACARPFASGAGGAGARRRRRARRRPRFGGLGGGAISVSAPGLALSNSSFTRPWRPSRDRTR